MGLLTAAVVGTLGAGGAVVAAPFVLGAAGFTAAGITAGSYAAGMMSAAAVANGGAVAAGSTMAVLQSLGEFKLPTALTEGNLEQRVRLVWEQLLLLQLLVLGEELHWL
ncbi:unnamed protein product [Gadus morhua 'NCC']